MRYALSFVPHYLEREKLALLRRQLCKRFENRKAVMYPVHLTLVRTFAFADYKSFMRALETFCAAQRPVKLKLDAHLTSRNGWGGIEIEPSAQLARLQQGLVTLCAEYGDAEQFAFDPHISLVHAKGLPSLHSRTSPVKKLLLDRVALIIQTDDDQPYRIAKHIALDGKDVDLQD